MTTNAESGHLQNDDRIQKTGNDSTTNLTRWELYRMQENILHAREIRNVTSKSIGCQFPPNSLIRSVSSQEDNITCNVINDNTEGHQNALVEPHAERRNQPEKYKLCGMPTRLLHGARREYIVQDSTERFFLVEGDSLLHEAAKTKTWKYGQQLHLFYIIELYLGRLIQHVGRCEVVFFKDMENIWSKDVIMSIFRCALIKHLINNCNIVVHYEWENVFCEKWRAYLSNERPSFIFLHDGYKTSIITNRFLNVLTYFCLAESLDVAYTRDVYVMSSKLYAIYLKTNRTFIEFFKYHRDKFEMSWRDAKLSCSGNLKDIPMNKKAITDTLCIRDKVFMESASIYWNNLTKRSDCEKYFLCQWAHYFAIISVCTLSERLAIIPVCNGRVFGFLSSDRNRLIHRFNTFTKCILQCLHGEVFPPSNCTVERIADLLDFELCKYLFESDMEVSNACVTEEIRDKYLQLIALANSNEIPLAPIMPRCEKGNMLSYETKQTEPKQEQSVATISSRLSEEYAGDVRKTLNIEKDFFIFKENRRGAFDETYHWHSGKPLYDDLDRQKETSLSKVPRIRMKQLQGIQKFNRYSRSYAETLDKGLKPVVIATDTMKRQSRKAKPTHATSVQKKGEKKMGKSALSIIEKNKDRIKLKDMENVASKWAYRKAEVDKIEDPKVAIKVVFDFVNALESGLGYEDPIFYLLKLQYCLWERSCLEGNKSLAAAAELIYSMQKILLEERYTVSDKLRKTVAKYFRKIGYEDVACMIVKDLPDEKVLRKKFIGIPYNIFQMQYMGHLMKRNERSDPDPRVTGFIPDTWQRELLDVVDNNESALVVAPTSSGKTFCSYYCMEKVLREGNEGIVVYVSPTKALVNQVHAFIYGRFSKNMPDGQTLVGVFTRDYQHNAMTCQILVTVPQCLEILLLSPKRQDWASRLSYVIFDEVHCIGGEIGGEVWEHLITLIRCPFLALSATIGNPKEFHSWLSTVQSFKYKQECPGTQKGKDESGMIRPNVKLVTYGERYSDLQKSVYVPGTDTECDNLVETHPCMFLDSHSLRIKGFPSGMNLSSKEAYELWLCGKYTFQEDENATDSLEAWCPTKYFENEPFITKRDVRQYEVSLKGHVFQLIQGTPTRAAKLIGYFRDQFSVKNTDKENSKYVDIPGISETEFDIYEAFPALIEKLKAADKLPVLVFMCDRSGVEELAKSLKDHVDHKLDETMIRLQKEVQHTEKLEDMLENMKDIRDQLADVPIDADEPSRISKAASKKTNSPSGKKVVEYTTIYNELQKHKLKIQKERSKCTFVSQSSVSTEYVDETLDDVRNTDDVELLRLGISYHHAGCLTKFRGATEKLFRMKCVQVVTATTTLALGIHMPCKTVVIVGDDHYVDALNYRQMIGRSGRRGFDNVGNVIFYGVPVQKISTLITADLPSLYGLYPISCTLVLRLLLLVSSSANEESAHKKAMVVLTHPFFTHQKPAFQNQLKHFFLFTTDHLIRQLLVDEKGVPLEFAGLVSHLHYLEPGNMVFVYLLRKGVFHGICKGSMRNQHIHYEHTCKLCKMSPIVGKMFQREGDDLCICEKCDGDNRQNQIGGNKYIRGDFVSIDTPELKHVYSEETMRLLVCILSHIFCVKEIPNIRLRHDERHPGSKKLKTPPVNGSKVLLDPLPHEFLTAIDSYNDEVRSNFSNYLCVVSQSVQKQGYVALPLSHKQWSLSLNEESVYTSGQATNVLMPFVRQSGCTNKDIKKYCLDREEIFRILPPEIFMDFKSIPALYVDVTKNAYALDFFKHGSLTALLIDNQLQKGEVFSILKDFMLMILAISTALEELGPEEGDDNVIMAFKHLSLQYRERFMTRFPHARKF